MLADFNLEEARSQARDLLLSACDDGRFSEVVSKLLEEPAPEPAVQTVPYSPLVQEATFLSDVPGTASPKPVLEPPKASVRMLVRDSLEAAYESGALEDAVLRIRRQHDEEDSVAHGKSSNQGVSQSYPKSVRAAGTTPVTRARELLRETLVSACESGALERAIKSLAGNNGNLFEDPTAVKNLGITTVLQQPPVIEEAAGGNEDSTDLETYDPKEISSICDQQCATQARQKAMEVLGRSLEDGRLEKAFAEVRGSSNISNTPAERSVSVASGHTKEAILLLRQQALIAQKQAKEIQHEIRAPPATRPTRPTRPLSAARRMTPATSLPVAAKQVPAVPAAPAGEPAEAIPRAPVPPRTPRPVSCRGRSARSARSAPGSKKTAENCESAIHVATQGAAKCSTPRRMRSAIRPCGA